MKIALLIAGYLRGIQENIINIKKFIIQDNEYDIYMHITCEDSDSKYLNKEVSIEYIRKELDPKVLLFSKNINFTRDKAVDNLLNQNYKYYWLNEEMKKMALFENIVYDIVFKIRPDVHINDFVNFDNGTNLNKIYIPLDSKIDKNKLRGRDDNYICDIMAYGSPLYMNIYFDYYNHLLELINKHGMVNETLLYHYLMTKEMSYELVDIKFIVILSLCNTIAITGDSGSGKTTVSNILKKLFNNSFILECDRYHKWERGHEQWNNYTHLNPEANYITKMQKDVFDLKIGRQIFQVDYDHNTGKFTDKNKIESAENIIVCGLHSLYLSETIVNLKIYMDTDDNLRIPWKIKRDIKKRGYSIERIVEQIRMRDEDFKKYISPQKKEADIIIHLFTDKIFDISLFDLQEEYNIYFKIGIHIRYNINNIIHIFNSNIEKITTEEDDQFIYLYFKDIGDYEKVIKALILNCK